MQVQAGMITMQVSTHSRLKAAGPITVIALQSCCVSTHSRLKAAGLAGTFGFRINMVSTHSRLKAAGPSPPLLC